jgi:hypothetical protein
LSRDPSLKYIQKYRCIFFSNKKGIKSCIEWIWKKFLESYKITNILTKRKWRIRTVGISMKFIICRSIGISRSIYVVKILDIYQVIPLSYTLLGFKWVFAYVKRKCSYYWDKYWSTYSFLKLKCILTVV